MCFEMTPNRIIFLFDVVEQGGVNLRAIRQAKGLRQFFPSNVEIEFVYFNYGHTPTFDPEFKFSKFTFGIAKQLVLTQKKTLIICLSGRAFLKILLLKALNENIKSAIIQAVPIELPGIKNIKNFFRKFFVKTTYRFAEKVISVSIELNSIMQNYVTPSNCVYCPNPVLITMGKKAVKTENSQLRKVIAIGRLDYQKDYHLMIEAISNTNSELILEIFGEGPGRSELEAQIASLKLENKVVLKGYNPDILQLIDSYDLFVMTSRWEGLPSAYLEAQMFGIPSVCIVCPTGIMEINAQSKRGEILELRDPTLLAEAIDRQIIKSKKINKKLIEYYSIANTTKELAKIIDEI